MYRDSDHVATQAFAQLGESTFNLHTVQGTWILMGAIIAGVLLFLLAVRVLMPIKPQGEVTEVVEMTQDAESAEKTETAEAPEHFNWFAAANQYKINPDQTVVLPVAYVSKGKTAVNRQEVRN